MIPGIEHRRSHRHDEVQSPIFPHSGIRADALVLAKQRRQPVLFRNEHGRRFSAGLPTV